LKTSSLSLSAAAAAVLAAALVAVSTAAQAPQKPTQAEQPAAGEHAHAEHEPAPTNLQVLPKTLTGEQVHHIMHGWAESLGVHCDTCHTADPGKKGPNGFPVLKFADDSKPEKKAARLMFKMTNDINENYVSMVDEGKGKVTCGTCHRGHLKPEAFVPPPEHQHPHPPAAQPGK
jgi:hypothetical protein